jgi:hypothetical protein
MSSRLRRWIGLGGAACVVAAGIAAGTAGSATADARRLFGDFNFDGYHDLVVASPLEEVGGIKEAGVVRIFYGGPNGPASGGVQTLTQNVGNFGSTVEKGDRFGSAIAVGDLAPGVGSTLVIGVPFEDDDDLPGRQDSGMIHILRGGLGSFLNVNAVTTLTQLTAHSPEANGLAEVEAGDQWGAALAIGRFGRSGSDLVVGAPGEDITVVDGGAVDVLHFEDGRLDHVRRLHQDENFVEGDARAGDRFGAAVAVGNFNNDVFSDLAVGAPGDQEGAVDPGGEVNVFYGGNPDPLSVTTDQLWKQGSSIPETREPGDAFGAVLAVGDFGGIGDDLVIGVPGEDDGAGAVHVLYGTSTGLTAARTQLWRQNADGLPDTRSAGDRFGAALVAGDFNNDGQDDLAVGVPGEDTEANPRQDVGAVQVIYGNPNGPNSPNAKALGPNHQQFFFQTAIGVNAEAFDRFGASLAAGDYNKSNKADLAIGVPGESISDSTGAAHGQVNVIFGKKPLLRFGGLDPDDHLLIQRPGFPQANGQFGLVVR